MRNPSRAIISCPIPDMHPKLKIVRHPSADSFLDQAESWLMQAEVENNVILSVARSIARKTLIPKEPAYLATAVRSDAVVACLLRTPPHKLVASHAPGEAIDALAAAAFTAFPDLPAMTGPEPMAGAFARAWSRLTGTPARVGVRQRLYVVDTIVPVQSTAAGLLRPATEADLDLAHQWATAFAEEAMPYDRSDPNEAVVRCFKTGDLFFWEDNGPATLCAVGGRTPNGARVSFVYTPPSKRRRGYATAAVAALTRRLLLERLRYGCLYADLANPTSNRIYQKVGYRPLRDCNDYLLAEA